jgi:hypothetical protein
MFTFALVNEDGTRADPPRFVTAVPNWKPGDTFLLRPGRVLRILAIEAGEEPPPHATWTVERVT